MEKTDIFLVLILFIVMGLAFRTQISIALFGPGTGNFIETGDDVCTEGGKPIVYFFGSEACPHCRWEKPIIRGVIDELEDYVSYHENIDNNEDREILARYSSHGVPFIVIGCRYVQSGAGESIGESREALVLKSLICELVDAPEC